MKRREKMARKVSIDDIRQMNEIYYKCKSYAETARQTGWSASTVSKYVDKNYQPVPKEDIRHFEGVLPQFDEEMLDVLCNTFDTVCVLSKKEIEEIEELWKELPV
jgi:hypothetical protein